MSYFELAAEQLELNLAENPWTPARETLLRDLSDQGSSAWVARQINAQTGSDFTRNAIIGKSRRIGLKPPKKNPVNLHTEGQLNRHRKARMRLSVAPLPDGQILDLLEPDMMPMGIDGLQNTTCRWPCGDPKEVDFFYCGADGCDVVERRPYCKFHAMLAYAPARSRAA